MKIQTWCQAIQRAFRIHTLACITLWASPEDERRQFSIYHANDDQPNQLLAPQNQIPRRCYWLAASMIFINCGAIFKLVYWLHWNVSRTCNQGWRIQVLQPARIPTLHPQGDTLLQSDRGMTYKSCPCNHCNRSAMFATLAADIFSIWYFSWYLMMMWAA